jgi:ribosomal protein L18E
LRTSDGYGAVTVAVVAFALNDNDDDVVVVPAAVVGAAAGSRDGGWR